jgi:hypothetical protein
MLGPEKMYDTCRETVHMGMMDKGFTVFDFDIASL